MQVIYIDTLFLINFIIDYFALLLTAKICALTVSRLRIAGGAILGGAYSVAAIFEAFYFLGHPAMKIVCGIFMALIVFGGQKTFLRICLVFFAVSAAFGGAVLAVTYLSGGDIYMQTPFSGVTLKILILSFAISYALFSLIFKRTARNTEGGGIADMTVELGGRKVKMKALCDTGNSLSDPLTGRAVAVTDIHTVYPLFKEAERSVFTEENIRDPIKLIEAADKGVLDIRLRLVPYKAIGVNDGMLAAFLPDSVYINEKLCKNMLIALSPDCVTDGGAYSALVGGKGA